MLSTFETTLNSFTNINTTSIMDEKILKMMEKMGYQKGQGLGKNQQGTTNIVEASKQLGKRGLGLEIDNLQHTDELWDFDKEEIIIEKQVAWLHYGKTFDNKIPLQWIVKGPTNHDIENECNFCDDEIVTRVFRAKDIFNSLDVMELGLARARANPFETLKSSIFMNRAALKIAEIDKITEWSFTNINQNPYFSHEAGPFYFADVCAGPGGFTEYILWRKQWHFKGFGMTLKDDHDFKVNESQCASGALFQSLYGTSGDGDVTRPENISDFVSKVRHETYGKGVHFMMSDGGFSVEGNENIQEILSKKIYICQCLIALKIVRQHGNFVTKIFDIFTPFSVGLLYLMYLCFEKVGIIKPNSSRPANSERYFMCYNLKSADAIRNIVEYLDKCVECLCALKDNSELDILEIVPLDVIKSDKKFFDYIVRSNNRLATNQIVSLEKLGAFCRNPNLIDVRQETLRIQSLAYWNLPDVQKLDFVAPNLDELLQDINLTPGIFDIQTREIGNLDNLNLTIKDLKDWHYAPMYTSKRLRRCNLYAAVDTSKIYRRQNQQWFKINGLKLVKGTLLYGEMVQESILSTSNSQLVKRSSLHVIDAVQLGTVNISKLPYKERFEQIKIYCKTVNREAEADAQYKIRVRPKPVQQLSQLVNIQTDIQRIPTGNFCMKLPVLSYGDVYSEFFEFNSILLLNTNERQNFERTYIQRAQIFLWEENERRLLNLNSLTDFLQPLL